MPSLRLFPFRIEEEKAKRGVVEPITEPVMTSQVIGSYVAGCGFQTFSAAHRAPRSPILSEASIGYRRP